MKGRFLTLLRGMPFAKRLVNWLRKAASGASRPYSGSAEYWRRRYDAGGDSGDGSLGDYARHKANFINRFTKSRRISSILEFGCGDGGQLTLADYPSYLGFEVSESALNRCRKMFHADRLKKFKLMHEYSGERAELTLSLDVIYHLTEDDVFLPYMARLFDSSDRWVIIYSTDADAQVEGQAPHVRHRRFSDWVQRERPVWRLVQQEPGLVPGAGASFFVFEKTGPGQSSH